MRSHDSFLLSFPADLLEKTKTRLQMFIVMSDVIIEDISNEYLQIGLINEDNSNAFSINEIYHY
jgi:folate-binding Fe-S cluster repair protein YgfZ